VREALAEVAALPPLQREVMVRTVVAGHSHEQVASDLGITHSAVRGLLYRARTTLRTAATALTPPPLLSWLLGRADQSGPAPERLAELAGGGGTVGLGGLLLKGGVVALTAATALTGAAIVHHIGRSTHHRARHGLLATAAPAGAARAGAASAQAAAEVPPSGLSAAARSHRAAHQGGPGSRGVSGARVHAGSRSDTGVHPSAPAGGGRRERVGLSPARGRGDAGHGAPSSEPPVQSPSPPSGSGQEPAQGGGSSQGSGSGQSGSSGAGQAAPVGSAASNGSGGQAGAGSSPTQGSGEGGGAAPSGGQSGSGSEPGSGSSSPEESSSSGQGSSSGSSEPSSGSSGEQGSLVGTVVHEVGNVLEHLLH
jgi:hypothetical protein